MALGDHEGTATLEIRADIQESTLLEEVGPRQVRRVDCVPMRRFDTLFDAIARPALCKIDVQGAELMVLSGMTGRLTEIDAMVIEGLKNKKPEVLFQLPRQKLRGGTSEILNWVALAGAMEDRELKYFEYVTTYRSPAATGCGMGFAYWI